MPSNYNNALRLEIIGNGEQAGNWGNTTNVNLGTLLVQAITGVENVTMAGDTTLTVGNGVSDQARNAVLILGGTLSGAANLIVPSVNKVYIVRNATANGQTVTVKTAAGTGVALLNGYTQLMYCDGTNVIAASQSLNSAVAPGTVSSITLATTGTGLTVNGGTSANIQTSGTFTLAGTLEADNGGTGLSSIPAAGRLLISDGTAYVPGQINGGTAITTSYAGGNYTINNTGVTSLTQGAGILLSGSTGNVTITATGGGGSSGVTQFSAGSTGLSPAAFSTGNVTLGGVLLPTSGGTGLITFTSADRALYSSSATSLVAGTLPVAAGGTGVQTSTGTGSNVLSSGPSLTSPVLTTPSLGTPTSGTLTNCTGLPLSTGVTGTLNLSTQTSGALDLSTKVSGTLGVSNGGTGTNTALSTGSVVFAGASGVYSQDNANLFWDNTAKTLKSPEFKLTANSARFYTTSTNTVIDFNSNSTLYYNGSNLYEFSIAGAKAFSIKPAEVNAYAFNPYSDRALKKDITPVSGGLGRVLSYKPVTYRWIDQRISGDSLNEGFIAQDIESVNPIAVTYSEGVACFNPVPIIADLVAAIQELSAQVKALKAQVEGA